VGTGTPLWRLFLFIQFSPAHRAVFDLEVMLEQVDALGINSGNQMIVVVYASLQSDAHLGINGSVYNVLPVLWYIAIRLEIAVFAHYFSFPIDHAVAIITIIAMTNVIIAPLLSKMFSIVAPATSHAVKNPIRFIPPLLFSFIGHMARRNLPPEYIGYLAPGLALFT
jgi:hypothetical protein